MTDLDDFQARVAEWGNRTFPQSNRWGKFAHLIKEIRELEDALEPAWLPNKMRTGPNSTGRMAEEAADCLMLLLHICAEQGVSLAAAAEAKFAEVQTRQWGPADEHGVVEHVR